MKSNANTIIRIRNDAKEFAIHKDRLLTLNYVKNANFADRNSISSMARILIDPSFKNVGTRMEFLHQLLLLLIMTYLKMLIDPFQQKMQ